MRRQITPIMLCGMCLFIAILFFPPSQAAFNKLVSPEDIQCACPGDILTFTCTIVGGGNTLWSGSAFNCPSTSNEIILRHSQFGTQGGISGSCNNEAIVGQSVGVQNNNCFTSQLSVPVSEGLNGTTVQCDHNVNSGTRTIGSATLNVVTNPYAPPSDVGLIDFDQRQVTFNWTSVSSSCPTIDYVITSDCGVCPSSTNTTTVTCSDLQLPTQSDNSVCSFNVSSRVCGVVGNQTTSVLAARVPSVPLVNVIPQYSNSNQSLIKLSVTIMTMKIPTEVIINDISGSILRYIVAYSTPTTMVDTSSIPVESSSCQDDACTINFAVPSAVCLSSSNIDVTVSAANRIGQGPSSDGITIGCTNQFVQVEYDTTASTITCRFLNETDKSIKSCTVMYGECGQELVQTTQGSSTMETPNNIVLSVDANVFQFQCYVVTASSDVLTVRVELYSLTGSDIPERGTVNIAATVVPIIIVVLLLLVVVVLMSVFVARIKGGTTKLPVRSEECKKDNRLSDVAMTNINEMELQLLPNGRFSVYPVNIDCELREFLEEQQLEFKRGCAFYEFVHDFERISEDQEIILMEEEQRAFSSFKSDTKRRLLGDKVPKPSIGGYRVFVQNVGSGARHLPRGSLLLYEEESPTSSSKPDPPFMPIISAHFKMITLPSTVTIKEFCQANKIPNDYSIFVEHGTFEKKTEADLIDVILQDKEDGSLYSGPTARQMVQDPDLDKWRMFVLYKFYEDMKLQAGTKILHQAPGCTQISIENFHVLTVDEVDGCMCMSDFVKQKAMVAEFTNGHAFYEFTKEEDLQCYKDVVQWPSGEGNVVLQVNMGIDLFYRLPGVLGVRVKPPNTESMSVFIQSTSQGARCVKPGDTILYKKK